MENLFETAWKRVGKPLPTNPNPVNILSDADFDLIIVVVVSMIISQGYFVYGGNDGPRDDKGSPAPNADCFQFEMVQGGFRWKIVEFELTSMVPPARLTSNIFPRFSCTTIRP